MTRELTHNLDRLLRSICNTLGERYAVDDQESIDAFWDSLVASYSDEIMDAIERTGATIDVPPEVS